ncbi:putative TIM-barrel fold metal-dependent hydrolase [Sinorhizobium kostiense]|uniref:TIM-barrel fold metal-dependent hydrolase n=1 Tax=Sinorhizobium kostiense TaxID=76747 RepID=A0ABS4R2L5_9HYPH|nr:MULTISPECIES: amidohydrolase family protein [Sinorhizobium]MBP2236534.1 putative TIM-barrel fold metal-dependent hydrolase [Sinorhizobium kostiense]
MSSADLTRRQMLQGMAVAAAAVLSPANAFAQEVPFSAGSAHPKFKAPPKTCDAHFHIYNSKFPAAANASLVPQDASVSDYHRLKERLGFERSVIVQPSTYGTDNSCLLEALAELGDAARGIAVVDTSVTDGELKRLDAAGVRGIRFNLARAGATTVDMIEPLAKRVADLGWHIQVHIKGDSIAEHAGLFQNLPVITVFDHLGRIPQPAGKEHPAFKVVADLLEKGKAYTKLSSIYQDTLVGPPTYADMGGLAKAYLALAPDRVLWATDWPHPSPGKSGKPDDALLMDLCAEWAGDDPTRSKIFVENAAGLYGF